MSDVASLDLCKELYEVSEWEADAFRDGITPAYDLGYLLRKLPVHISIESHATLDGKGSRWYKAVDNSAEESCRAVTPEDAAAKLAIELFKQGVLTNGSR